MFFIVCAVRRNFSSLHVSNRTITRVWWFQWSFCSGVNFSILYLRSLWPLFLPEQCLTSLKSQWLQLRWWWLVISWLVLSARDPRGNNWWGHAWRQQASPRDRRVGRDQLWELYWGVHGLFAGIFGSRTNSLQRWKVERLEEELAGMPDQQPYVKWVSEHGTSSGGRFEDLFIWRHESCQLFPPSNVIPAHLCLANASQICEKSNSRWAVWLLRLLCFVFFCCFFFVFVFHWCLRSLRAVSLGRVLWLPHLAKSVDHPTRVAFAVTCRHAGSRTKGSEALWWGVNLGRFSCITSFIIYIYNYIHISLLISCFMYPGCCRLPLVSPRLSMLLSSFKGPLHFHGSLEVQNANICQMCSVIAPKVFQPPPFYSMSLYVWCGASGLFSEYSKWQTVVGGSSEIPGPVLQMYRRVISTNECTICMKFRNEQFRCSLLITHLGWVEVLRQGLMVPMHQQLWYVVKSCHKTGSKPRHPLGNFFCVLQGNETLCGKNPWQDFPAKATYIPVR